MPMAVINWSKFFHLFSVMLAFGGAAAQLLVLTKSRGTVIAEVEANEKMNLAIVRLLLFPGLMMAFVLGLLVAGLSGRFAESWIHAKLTLALMWVVLAHIQLRGAKRIVALRAAGATAALEKTKSIQLNIARGVGVLILVILYFAVFKPNPL